jgi:hypothetical protein
MGVGILFSIRLLNNVIARFMDQWIPASDRRIARAVVKGYKVFAIGSVIFITIGVILYKLKLI